MRWAQSMAAAGILLAGCTVISVEGDHNRISDAGGHGGLTFPEGADGGGAGAHWLQRLERLERLEHRERRLGNPPAPR